LAGVRGLKVAEWTEVAGRFSDPWCATFVAWLPFTLEGPDARLQHETRRLTRTADDVVVEKDPRGAWTATRRERVIVTKADEDAIREIELRFNEAWGRHDPDGMVDSLVDDAQFVTVNGAWTKSRAGFRDLMQRLHGANGPFRSSTRDTPEMHVRFLAPDVAVMHTRFHIYGDIDEAERTSIGTRVVRKLDGRWRTVAVQNTDLRLGRRD
jgi:uncharacterized protein (TIGR02246 family)